MKRSFIRRRRFIRRLALGFAVAAIAAPSAQAFFAAGEYPGNRASAGGAYGELHQHPNAGLGGSETISVPLPPMYAPAAPNAVGGGAATTVGDWEAAGYDRIYGTPDTRVITPAPAPPVIGVGPGGYITAPSTSLPQFSVDGPRTAPDVLVRPIEPTPVGGTGLDWGDTGIGIGIGMAAAAMLGAALLLGSRVRRTLHGV